MAQRHALAENDDSKDERDQEACLTLKALAQMVSPASAAGMDRSGHASSIHYCSASFCVPPRPMENGCHPCGTLRAQTI